jgi:hypothetical protein
MQGQVSSSECKNQWWCQSERHLCRYGMINMLVAVAFSFNFCLRCVKLQDLCYSGLPSSTRRQGMWLRSANWEWCMSLRRNHHLQLQRVLRKGRRREVLFQKMAMPMVLTSLKWVLNLSCFRWTYIFPFKEIDWDVFFLLGYFRYREDLLNDLKLKKNLQRYSKKTSVLCICCLL